MRNRLLVLLAFLAHCSYAQAFTVLGNVGDTYSYFFENARSLRIAGPDDIDLSGLQSLVLSADGIRVRGNFQLLADGISGQALLGTSQWLPDVPNIGSLFIQSASGAIINGMIQGFDLIHISVGTTLAFNGSVQFPNGEVLPPALPSGPLVRGPITVLPNPRLTPSIPEPPISLMMGLGLLALIARRHYF